MAEFLANQIVTQSKATSGGTPVSVASSIISVPLLAANANRNLAIIANNSTSILYVSFGVTASTTLFTCAIAPISNGIPSLLIIPGWEWSGIITGIWTSANGNALVTETI